MRFGESRRKQRMIWWRYPKHGFHIHKLLQNNGVPLVLKCCLPAPAHQLTPLNYRGWDGGPRSQAGRGRPVLRRASGRPEPVGSELHPSAGWARAPKAAERQHRQGELSPDKLGCFRGKPNTFEPLGFRSTAPEAPPPPPPPPPYSTFCSGTEDPPSPRKESARRAEVRRGQRISQTGSESSCTSLPLAKGQISRERGRGKSVIRALSGHAEPWWDLVRCGELNAGKEETLAIGRPPPRPREPRRW